MAEESSPQSSQSQSSSHKSSEDAPKNPQGPGFCGNGASPNGAVPTFPIMYPALVPGLFNLQNQEQMNHGAGIYAVPVSPFMSHVTGFPPNTLIPLTYNIPT
ncbi:hypothetical protein Acr_20g0004500 [Actinidia rufa]|uniref:Uncharacterized protein n=1 Tax=Actinidia rufa TaxID=165716 RepID=A0A7J0GD22_9ERIC|nr:hypothetical protein Acr_20g0004500 [Actinidia rufa]